MLQPTHHFLITVLGPEGEVIARREARNFTPLYEDVLFTAVRQGKAANDGGAPPGRLEPLWRDGKLGGLKATVGDFAKTYPLKVLSCEAWSMLEAAGLLESDEKELPQYHWYAEAISRNAQEAARRRLRVSLTRAPFPFERCPLDVLGISTRESGGTALEVYVSRRLLEELCKSAADSLDAERADVLTGQLVAVPDDGVAVVLRHRIPVPQDSLPSRLHFRFSPLAFQATQEEHLRRGNGDVIVGWAHNHPPLCGRDCLKVVPACETDTVFLSIADQFVFRASFTAPYMVGLVSGKGAGRRADAPAVKAFGWQDAMLTEIPYTVFEDPS